MYWFTNFLYCYHYNGHTKLYSQVKIKNKITKLYLIAPDFMKGKNNNARIVNWKTNIIPVIYFQLIPQPILTI